MIFTLNSQTSCRTKLGSHRDTFCPYLIVTNAKNRRLISCEVAQQIFKTVHCHQKMIAELLIEKREELKCEMAFIGLELYDEGYNCGPTVVGESGKSFNEICTLERINNGRQQLHRCFHPGYYCLALAISWIFYSCLSPPMPAPPFFPFWRNFSFPATLLPPP